MFVFDTEDGPETTTTNFRERDDEAQHSGMLQVVCEDGVKDPVESHNHIQDHGNIVYPCSAEGKDLAQEGIFGVRITQTPIHCQVPHGGVHGVE